MIRQARCDALLVASCFALFLLGCGKQGVEMQPPQSASTLTLFGVTSADVAAYYVVVTNLFGSITSDTASLQVGIPIVNASFEADTFATYPGYVSGNGPITGWNGSLRGCW